MFSISMAYNVFSCKKNPNKYSNNQNSRFYHVNSAPMLRNDKIYPQKTDYSIGICSFFLEVWCILYATWQTLSSCPLSRRFRICMTKGGRGCFRLSGPPLFGLHPNRLFTFGLFMIELSQFGLPMMFGLSPFGLREVFK